VTQRGKSDSAPPFQTSSDASHNSHGPVGMHRSTYGAGRGGRLGLLFAMA
jgi:hypothetical protein